MEDVHLQGAHVYILRYDGKAIDEGYSNGYGECQLKFNAYEGDHYFLYAEFPDGAFNVVPFTIEPNLQGIVINKHEGIVY